VAATPFHYEVSRQSPHEARDDVLRVWQRNLDLEWPASKKFDWLYHECPTPAHEIFLLKAKSSSTDGAPKVVGTVGIALRQLCINGTDVPVIVVVDLAVDRKHRSLLPALRLTREVQLFAKEHCLLAYGYPNHAAEGVFKRAEYLELGRLTRYARVLRPMEYVDRLDDYMLAKPLRAMSTFPGFRQWLETALNDGHWVCDTVRAISSMRSFHLDWIDIGMIDERFDRLWATARQQYGVVGRRDAVFLRWRYAHSRDTQVATLTGCDRDDLRAYAIVELADGIAHIHDIFGAQQQLPALLDQLMPELYRRGAVVVSLAYLGGLLQPTLDKHGFTAREAERQVVLVVGQQGERYRQLANQPQRWHLLDIDEDI